MSNTFALLYQPPCGQWYVHSHKLYPTPEAADAAAVKFLHPDTPRVVIPITFPATPSQRLDAATVERALEICPQCAGSGVGVADTTCTRCNGSGGVA